jgi:hypothetical protein
MKVFRGCIFVFFLYMGSFLNTLSIVAKKKVLLFIV